jgi:hypothetical protein
MIGVLGVKFATVETRRILESDGGDQVCPKAKENFQERKSFGTELKLQLEDHWQWPFR